MNTTNDGGSAFPITPCGTGDPRDGMSRGSDGMSLRDWFAGMALQGFISGSIASTSGLFGGCDLKAILKEPGQELAVKYSYLVADAMIKARE